MLMLAQHCWMDIRDTRRARLRALVEQHESAAAFARAHNLDPTYISQLLNKHRQMGEKAARKIEAAIGLPANYMDTPAPDTPNVREGPKIKGRLPLISWVQAGEWCEAVDIFEPGDAEDWLPCPFEHSDNAFCLAVVGQSMAPDYREGEIIAVDPAVDPRHGHDVVCRTPDGTVTFKRLQITPEGTYLLALNPDWPERMIKVPPDTHICGVVIGSWMRRC